MAMVKMWQPSRAHNFIVGGAVIIQRKRKDQCLYIEVIKNHSHFMSHRAHELHDEQESRHDRNVAQFVSMHDIQ